MYVQYIVTYFKFKAEQLVFFFFFGFWRERERKREKKKEKKKKEAWILLTNSIPFWSNFDFLSLYP